MIDPETRANVIDATTRHKAGLMAENVLRNLPMVTRYPHRGVTFSGTVAVCGAGPSLNAALPALRRSEAAIVAVNTAGPALAKANVGVDVLVCIESLDLSQHIRASKTSLIVLDLSAHPASWAAAIENGARVAWTCEQGVGTELAYELGVRPGMGGGFALSSALELARVGGATGVVLCGADLGYPVGNAYAAGAGWDGYTVERAGDRLRFTGRDDRDAVHEASNVPAIPRDRPLYEVPANGGGMIPTVYDFVEQRDWIAGWAKRAGWMRLDNASVGGALIQGWQEQRPSVLESREGWASASGILTTRYDSARQWILGQCEAADRISAFFHGEAEWPDSFAMATPIPLVIAVAAREMFMLRDAHVQGVISEGNGIVAQYGAIRRAAARVREVLT